MSSFRLLRVCTTGPYGALFSAFVEALPPDMSFSSALQACRENGFLYPADFKRAFEAKGAEVMEIIVDLPILQRKWLAEAGDNPESHDLADTFFRQISAFKPEIVHFQTLSALPAEVRVRIKVRCPGVKLVTGHRGFPIFNCAGYEDIDAMFLGHPRHHEHWHAVGVKTYHQDHAFDESLLPAIQQGLNARPAHSMTFIGTTGWGFGPHDGRYHDLLKLLRETDLEIWGNEPSRTPTTLRSRILRPTLAVLERMPTIGLKVLYKMGQHGPNVFMRAANAGFYMKSQAASGVARETWYLKEKPIQELYPERMHPPVFGLDYLRLLANSRITWNRQLEMDGAGANMRIFEACGVGTCQMSDERPEVTAILKPDEEIVTYKTIGECIDKAKYLLTNDAVRARIAAAGQQRVLRDHTTAQRAAEMHDQFEALLA